MLWTLGFGVSLLVWRKWLETLISGEWQNYRKKTKGILLWHIRELLSLSFSQNVVKFRGSTFNYSDKHSQVYKFRCHRCHYETQVTTNSPGRAVLSVEFYPILSRLWVASGMLSLYQIFLTIIPPLS